MNNIFLNFLIAVMPVFSMYSLDFSGSLKLLYFNHSKKIKTAGAAGGLLLLGYGLNKKYPGLINKIKKFLSFEREEAAAQPIPQPIQNVPVVQNNLPVVPDNMMLRADVDKMFKEYRQNLDIPLQKALSENKELYIKIAGLNERIEMLQKSNNPLIKNKNQLNDVKEEYQDEASIAKEVAGLYDKIAKLQKSNDSLIESNKFLVKELNELSSLAQENQKLKAGSKEGGFDVAEKIKQLEEERDRLFAENVELNYGNGKLKDEILSLNLIAQQPGNQYPQQQNLNQQNIISEQSLWQSVDKMKNDIIVSNEWKKYYEKAGFDKYINYLRSGKLNKNPDFSDLINKNPLYYLSNIAGFEGNYDKLNANLLNEIIVLDSSTRKGDSIESNEAAADVLKLKLKEYLKENFEKVKAHLSGQK